MQKHAEVVDRFRINKNHVKMIFVDETLIQIDGKDFILAKNKAVNVVVWSRTEREINSVVEGIKKLTGNSSVLGIKCDVSIYLQLVFIQTQDLPNQTESSYIQSVI
jgi:hypothetical protein